MLVTQTVMKSWEKSSTKKMGDNTKQVYQSSVKGCNPDCGRPFFFVHIILKFGGTYCQKR